MSELLRLELTKLKRTFLTILFVLAFLVPIVLVLIQYGFDSQTNLNLVVTKSSVFIQMISFACVIISGCYITAREYKNNLISYLKITPKSITQILLCKYIVMLIEIAVLQLSIFGTLFIINSKLYGFDAAILLQYLTASALSTISLFCITPAVIYVALLKRDFTSSALIFLILFMLTYPFTFMDYGYVFPHLIPIILVSKFLGYERYAQISYISGALILAAVFALFLYLSIRKIRMKE